METLAVTIIQSHLHWENAVANRAHFSERIAAISEKTDLIVLPEMFTTGFSMNAKELSEATDGATLQWMISEAKKQQTAITGSVIIAENNTYYNRLFFVFPDGTYTTYDKRHTFTLAKEHETYTAGEERLLVEYKGWKICPLICYDLRFPVWARNTEAYDVLLYVANWPKKRITAWDALLKARAIENMTYCVGVNRIGLDGMGHEYVGHSAVYDVLGEQISTKDFETEFSETIVLQKSHITKNREHLQFLKDRDSFSLK
ncbi:amidohydrolase [Ulvibacter litoralis]|uniref:Omega-amidase YafV n=1 Tax=Ulvibacter litoralis TaxID=227084 RepID=A0A1G7CWT6_9FLAO|nr:amidohydrolase [Ulvibacter litoralis]GHC45768.1 amidohydrolase [Ulvibacter litoralis]SDE43782.1 Predicted amidohydrolase [Ulvibacter litoralis]